MWLLKIILTLHLVFGFGLVMSGCTASEDSPNGSIVDDTNESVDDDTNESVVISEGSLTSPVLLELDTLHTITVAMLDASYYQIDITEPGRYTFENNDSSNLPEMYIYSDSEFSTLLTSFLSTNELYFAIVDTGTYYIKVNNSGDYENLSFDTKAKFVSAFINEGNITSPILLTLPISDTINVDSAVPSYYKFSVEDSGYYKINHYFSEDTSSLYSDSSFSTLLAEGSPEVITTILTAGTTYYLKIATTTTRADQMLSISAMSVGSETSPIVLGLNTLKSGALLGGAVYEKSYYTFTTGVDGNYTIVLKNAENSEKNTDFHLYSDTFTSETDTGAVISNNGKTKLVTLSASTQYYLSVENLSTTETDYSIYVVKTALGSDGNVSNPQSITVNTPYSGGAASASDSFYSFSVPTLTTYNIAVEDISNHANYDYITLSISSESNLSTTYNYPKPLYYNGVNLYQQAQIDLNSTMAYLKVANAFNYNINCTIRVEEQVSNEGASNAPVALTFDAPYSAKVGLGPDLSQYSYYKITLPEAGDYTFTPSSLLSGTEYPLFYAGPLDTLAYKISSSQSEPTLSINYRGVDTQDIFIRAYNYTDFNTSYTLTASEGTTAIATNEGTVSAPESLIHGVNSQIKVGISSQIAEYSYYKFGGISIVTDGYYEVTSSELTFTVYSDVNFTTLSENGYYIFPLSASEAAYIKAKNTSSNDVVGDVNVTKISEGSKTSPINSLSVNSAYSGIVGGYVYTKGSNISYYAYNSAANSTTTSATIALANVTGVAGSQLTIREYDDSAYTSLLSSVAGDANLTIATPPSIVYFTITTGSTPTNASYDINITGN